MNTSTHNPDQYIASLRQILSQGRKRVGLMIGAGAPLAIKVNPSGKIDPTGVALIPGVDELTGRVLGKLDGQMAETAQEIRDDLGGGANIETILSRVRLLEQAIGKHTIGAYNGAQYRELAVEICKQIGSIVRVHLPNERNAYLELISWISGTYRTHAVEIFTTNYDLLLEEAFELSKAPYFDGFSGGVAPFFDPVTVAADDLPPRWSRLWKLHGSLGWSMEGETIVRRGGRDASQLVYPDHLKYDLTQKQPYSALFERLKRFLLTPDTLLLTIGCSYRDRHVCAVLDEALAMNTSAAVFAFQYGALDEEEAVCRLAEAHPNLSVYAADGAVVSGVSGKWSLRDPPKNWVEIRSSFWGSRVTDGPQLFRLGDFADFARFCALAQATHIASPKVTLDDASTPVSILESAVS